MTAVLAATAPSVRVALVPKLPAVPRRGRAGVPALNARTTPSAHVATGLGVIAMLMPVPSLIVFLVWLVIVMITKYVSLGSCIAAALVPVLAYVWGYPVPYTAFGVLAAAFIIIRHKSNIVRLMNGTENKIHAGHRD